MKGPSDSFPFRLLGEHPRHLRQRTLKELTAPWGCTEVCLLCPLVELIGAAVRKVRETRAPAMLLNPNWPRQP